MLGSAHDPEGDPLTVSEPEAKDHGVEIIGGAIVKLSPARDFHGDIVVNYKVSDGAHLVPGHAIVKVTAVNDAPTATAKVLNLHRTGPIVLDGSDVDNDKLTFELVTPPSHGTLKGIAPELSYVATSGFLGDDTFTYRVSDGMLTSEPATVALHIVPGSAPTAADRNVSATEDRSSSIVLQASDPDGDPLTFAVVTPPQHGILTGTPPQLTYTPASNYNGSDALTFTADDGYGASNAATVTINVAAVNDAPAATAMTVEATEDTAQPITLAGSDVEGDALTFQIATGPAHGTLTGTGASQTYRPALNYHGPDSFTFKALDATASSAPATVTINVATVDDPPTAQALSPSVSEDNTLSITLVGNDPDGDPLSFAIGTQPAHGTLTGAGSLFSYRPAKDYNGPDSFTYTVTAGGITSAPAPVSIQVTAVNDDPVASNSSVVTDEDTAVDIQPQATDVDSTALTFRLLTSPADGRLVGPVSNMTYLPAANTSGSRSFQFRVSDDKGGFSDGTITIEIRPVNDPPTVVDDYAMTEPGSPVTVAVLANDSDIEGDALRLDASTAPVHGSVDMVDGRIAYTPEPGFAGVDDFDYTVLDSHDAASTGHVHVGVGTPPPGAPTEVIATIGGTISDAALAPAISSDGRYLVMVSSLPLVPEDTNALSDIYVFDRVRRAMTRVSVASDGTQGDGSSFRPHISADGRFIVFDSSSSNLVPGDGNGKFDVFRHDRITGDTIRVSLTSLGAEANGTSIEPEVSDDGNLVVFQSLAFNLLAESDANGAQDIFVRNISAGTTTRVSVTALGGEADLGSLEPTISGDGRFVAFSSAASNLVNGDRLGFGDVFVRDLVANTTTRVSVSSAGDEASGASSRPSLSRDGRFVSFRSAATNLVAGSPTSAVLRLYVRDTQQTTTTMSVPTTGITAARLSADGRYVTAFTSFGTLIRDRFAGVTSTPLGSETWQWPAVSANGRFVVVLDGSGASGRLVVTPNPL